MVGQVRKFIIPKQISKVNTASAICAQFNLRQSLWAAIKSGYTEVDLLKEIARAVRLTGL